MTLSSFEPTVADGVVVGGVRTITVTNVLNEPLEAHSVDLGPAPCDCVVSGITAGTGEVTGGLWSVETLAPGETATVTFFYGQESTTITPDATTLLAGTLLSLMGLVGAFGISRSRLAQPLVATA